MLFEVQRVVPHALVRSGFAATRWGQRVPPPGPLGHEKHRVQLDTLRGVVRGRFAKREECCRDEGLICEPIANFGD